MSILFEFARPSIRGSFDVDIVEALQNRHTCSIAGSGADEPWLRNDDQDQNVTSSETGAQLERPK